MIFKTAKGYVRRANSKSRNIFLSTWEIRISPVNAFLARRKMLEIRNTNPFTFEKNNLWFVADTFEHYAKNTPSTRG